MLEPLLCGPMPSCQSGIPVNHIIQSSWYSTTVAQRTSFLRTVCNPSKCETKPFLRSGNAVNQLAHNCRYIILSNHHYVYVYVYYRCSWSMLELLGAPGLSSCLGAVPKGPISLILTLWHKVRAPSHYVTLYH